MELAFKECEVKVQETMEQGESKNKIVLLS